MKEIQLDKITTIADVLRVLLFFAFIAFAVFMLFSGKPDNGYERAKVQYDNARIENAQ